MKRTLICSCLLLLAALPASAQWGVNHRGTSQSGARGASNRGYSPSNIVGRYIPTYYVGGSSNYSNYSPAPAEYVPGVVTANAPIAPVTGYDLYVPSYMRPADGEPSLAEKAASLKATRTPAALTWSNWPAVTTTERKNN